MGKKFTTTNKDLKKRWFKILKELSNQIDIQKQIEKIVTNGVGFDSRIDPINMQLKYMHSLRENYQKSESSLKYVEIPR